MLLLAMEHFRRLLSGWGARLSAAELDLNRRRRGFIQWIHSWGPPAARVRLEPHLPDVPQLQGALHITRGDGWSSLLGSGTRLFSQTPAR